MTVTFTAFDPDLDRFLQSGDMAGYRAAKPANMTDVSCNFHNAGAADTLTMLGIHSEPCGRIPSADLSAVRRSIIRARNLPDHRAPFVHDGGTEGRIHWGSQPDALVMARLEALDAVLAHCQANGWDLQWG